MYVLSPQPPPGLAAGGILGAACLAPLALLLTQGLLLALPRGHAIRILSVLALALTALLLSKLSVFFGDMPRALWGFQTLL